MRGLATYPRLIGTIEDLRVGAASCIDSMLPFLSVTHLIREVSAGQLTAICWFTAITRQ